MHENQCKKTLLGTILKFNEENVCSIFVEWYNQRVPSDDSKIARLGM